jgi:pimeloyl-ACP methyl ester carboxylesterase
MPSARRTLTVAGEAAGYLQAGQGHALLLVHGAGGNAEVWAAQLDGLAGAARVVAVDLPGHGASEGRGLASVAAYAEWVVSFLDATGLDRVVLGGHSMGGAIAQLVALASPGRLRGLVLVGTGTRLRVLPRLVALLRADPPAGRSLVASLAYSPATPPGHVIQAERGLAETTPAVTLGDYVACDRFDVTADVHRIAVPTLVVVGRDDRLTPPKHAAHLAAAIRGARLVEVEHAGHFVQLEQPEATNAAVGDFLAGLPADGY